LDSRKISMSLMLAYVAAPEDTHFNEKPIPSLNAVEFDRLQFNLDIFQGEEMHDLKEISFAQRIVRDTLGGVVNTDAEATS
jgi:hypothetical protein